MRPLAVVLLGVLLLPGAAWATCTGTTPTLCLSLNQSSFQAGQTLQLSVTVTPGETPPPVDVYVALFIPPSTLLFLQGNGAFTTNVTPLAAGWTPSVFSGQLFGYAFGGGEPGGTYTWYGAFATPGTLSFLGGLASAAFQFTPPPVSFSGQYGLAGTNTASGCDAAGTFSYSGPLTLSQVGTTLTGNGTFYAPENGITDYYELTGSVSGTSMSGSLSFHNSLGYPGGGFFSGTLNGTTLTLTTSISVTVPFGSCGLNASLTGNKK